MPKRKGGRKKRGGSKQNPLANPGNVHNPKNFGSDQGLISGCAGCVGGHINIGSGCTLTNQADAQTSAIRGVSRLMNGINGRVGKIQTGGGNTAETTFRDLQNAAQNGIGYGRVPVTSVQNCSVQRTSSMGAGQVANNQKGGGIGQTAACVSAVNNLGTPGYGLNVKGTSDLNATLMGSGYPVVSPYNTNKCGGKRKTRKRRKHKKRRRHTKHKRKKYRRSRKKRGGNGEDDGKKKKTSCAGIRNAFGVCMDAATFNQGVRDAQDTSLGQFKNDDASQLMGYPSGRGGNRRKTRKKRGRSRKKRGGDVSTSQKMQQKWQQYIGFPPQLSGGSYKKRHNRKGGKRKTLKGGYAQFASNDPMTPGFSSPKPGPLPWATGPLSKSRQINCQNNYNHYTGKSSASPVLDQAAPVTPFGGTA